jgi:WD40 repeat protein
MSAAPVSPLRNPFPGLRPFWEHEAHLFFGRESQVDAMVNKLADTRFLAVVGASGSGKSSLVNCGLRPALRQGLMARAGTTWRMAQFRPGNDPISEMARALAKDGVLFLEHVTAGLTLAEIIETSLRMSKLGLIDIYEQAPLDDGTNLLVVVDQFEELFRYRQLNAAGRGGEQRISEEATAFVNLLLEVKERVTCPIFVVLTMRSDFLGECTQFPGLAEAINAGQYLVPRMTRDERRAAIEGPVKVGRAEIAPVLLTRLVNDVGDNPDQLSILQHALNRTWARWQNEGGSKGPLDLTHYEAIGTIAHALDQHAEQAYAELGNLRQQQICEKLFKALTDKATDPRGVRRPTMLGTLCALVEATAAEITGVIDVFRDPSRSFLMPPAGEPLKAETPFDISHESLMRVWQRLNTWADEEAQSAQTYRRLADRADLHAAGKAGLWRDPELQLALDWSEKNRPNEIWASRYHAGFAAAVAFLRESSKAREAERAEREEQRRRELLRTEELARLHAENEAREQRERANDEERARHEAELVAEAQKKSRLEAENKKLHLLTTLASLQVDNGDAVTGMLYILDLPDSGSVRSDGTPANAALYAGYLARREAAVLAGHSESVRSAAFSPDGNLLVTASEDKTARIWNRLTGTQMIELKGHQCAVTSAAFSPDGNLLVTSSQDKTARIWSVVTGKQIAKLKGHEDKVYSAQFSPDGNYLVTASEDKTARIWSAVTFEQLAILEGHEDRLQSAAFSPDSTHVVTASDDKTVRIWDVASHTQVFHTFKGHDDAVLDAGFSPDGRSVVTASYDKTARVWDFEHDEEIALLKGHTDWVLRAEFSRDGKHLVTGSRDKTARIWEWTQPEIEAFKGHEDRVLSTAFSPDGRRLVTASADKTARIWDTETFAQIGVLTGHEKPVISAAFSPDGKRVVTASFDNTARIWNAATYTPIKVLNGHSDQVYDATFSPDGKRVATASQDQTARIWDAETGNLIGLLEGHSATVRSVAFSPDGQRLVTASWDHTVRIWDAGTYVPIRVLKGHEREVIRAAFSPDGRRVVSASLDRTARIWNTETYTQRNLLKGHDGLVVSAAFDPAGNRVVTASFDQTARLWEAETDAPITVPIAVLKGYVRARLWDAAFSPDGARVVTAAEDRTARIWHLFPNMQLLIAEAKKVVPRCLTKEQRAEAYLDPTPPDWCIAMAKWPYNTEQWKAWLRQKKSGLSPPLPDAGH